MLVIPREQIAALIFGIMILIAYLIDKWIIQANKKRAEEGERLALRNIQVHRFKKHILDTYGPDIYEMLPEHDIMVTDTKELTENNYLRK